MKKKLYLTAFAVLLCSIAGAQEITTAMVELRGDAVYNGIGGTTVNDNTGFKGSFFNVLLKGTITDKLSFDIRQRVNRSNPDGTFFNATDKALLHFDPNEKWRLSFGKRAFAVGGFDFDTLPINLFYTSQYCIDLACFQWGISAAYFFNDRNDQIEFEMVQSPFRTLATSTNIYSYSTRWIGTHGPFDFIHSINLIETNPGKFINWIILGHRFNLDKWVIEADVINRSSLAGENSSEWFFKNMSLIGKIKYRPVENLVLSIKGSYDFNKCTPEYDYDYLVCPGTSCGRLGFIGEYFPLKDDRLRLHFVLYRDWGTNTCTLGGVTDKMIYVAAGATWRINFLKLYGKNH